ncbi:bifunctional PIG-L family deacetylase/class I SAM-dependent methyltransferase [Luteipulveratus flavus]|uniref:Bifunctional PIG-L family deacetylase/class I SAM-dependent methyltransferase n=1 Tax=Luteipulveratus flavus TaxID=3031728 RepID=A0ABT6C4F6_9MICO|nr:bifunctional PIG-L family deacetylase/class I SAM-dependent methyltransferase [Luteipulveratus sp. YIM 133296]MDF8263620.1 bifunctional PIG-L family deacetylase/class I SAM-dependent methyltransferase [Luteipulveratus sp. YIM 133296]
MVRSFTHDDAGTPAAVWAHAVRERDLGGLEPSAYERLVVVAAHPDDETLGSGGLIATAVALGVATHVLVATVGEASHPDSPTHSRADLAELRRHEMRCASKALGLDEADVSMLDIPDGGLADHLDDVTAQIVSLIGDGRRTLVVAPYRSDGHPDHEAMGRAAAAAAHRTGATLAEYPVWTWHAGKPDDLPWDRFVRVPLTASARAVKREAIACHASQVEPLSDQPGDEVLLAANVLEHFLGGQELFALTPAEEVEDDRLDRLHVERPDPWGVESRWYERRKRALLLAALPRARFGRGLEVGCSTGVLAQDLVSRVDRLVAVDGSAAAAERSEQRLGETAEVHRMIVPQQWPEGSFDLVVVSEIGYFLSPVALEGLVARVASCLTADGVVVLCHWRHPVHGWPLDAAAVHRGFAQGGLPPVAASYRDRDVEIVVHADPSQWPDPQR